MTDLPDALLESYDAVAASYVERLFTELDGKPLDRHLLNRFAEEIPSGGLVADVGCGPGHVARYLHDRGVRTVGVDLSPEMIRWAIERSPGLDFRVGDFRSLGFPDGALAGILAFYSVIHLDPAGLLIAFREFRRVLAPNGIGLVAFHIGEHTRHVDEMWGHRVSLDFRFLAPGDVTESLRQAGLVVTESVEREPYESGEHPSRRCYLLARAKGERVG